MLGSEGDNELIGWLCEKSEKMNEKKRNASHRLESTVRILCEKNQPEIIKKNVGFYVSTLISGPDLTLHQKRGGLLAIASICLGMEGYDDIAEKVIDEVLHPILVCLRDNSENKIRFLAAEALYNLLVSLRKVALIKFYEIYEGVLKTAHDLDDEVRKAVQAIDRFLKDLVNEYSSESRYFNLDSVMPRLEDRLNATNFTIRMMNLSWLNVFLSLPYLNVLKHLPRFIKALIKMLNDDNKEVLITVDSVLHEFLIELVDSSHLRSLHYRIEMLNPLVDLCNEPENNVLSKLTALTWMCEILKVQNEEMKSYSGGSLMEERDIYLKVQKKMNYERRHEFDNILANIFPMLLGMTDQNLREAVKFLDGIISEMIDQCKQFVNILPSIRCLMDFIRVHKEQINEALEWVRVFLNKFFEQLEPEMQELTNTLIELLSHQEESIVKTVVDTIALISKREYQYKIIVAEIINFYEKNQENPEILKSFETAIETLSRNISPIKILTEMATVNEKKNCSVSFKSKIAYNIIFMVVSGKNSQMKKVQEKLCRVWSNPNSIKSRSLFFLVFSMCCYCPLAVMLLCLLCKKYEVAYYVLMKTSANNLVDQKFLLGIPKILDVLESPVLMHTRADLALSESNLYLVKTLWGLLLFVEQGPYFDRLSDRLKKKTSVNNYTKYNRSFEPEKDNQLLRTFDKVIEELKKSQMVLN